MQVSYLETRLDQGLAIVAELAMGPFAFFWAIIAANLIEIAIGWDKIGEIGAPLAFLVLLSTIAAIESFLILWRERTALLVLSLIMAVPPCMITLAIFIWGNPVWDIGVLVSLRGYLLWVFLAGGLFQVPALSILLFRRLPFARHQKREERTT